MKKYYHLTKAIAVYLREKLSLSTIARFIGVSKSTVNRGIKRNSNMYNHYVTIDAQQFSEMRKAAPRHTQVIHYKEWTPYFVDFTSAATHDIRTLKGLQFSKISFFTIDCAYIDYAEQERLTRENTNYVTKTEKNLTYKVPVSRTLMLEVCLVEMIVSKVSFTKGGCYAYVSHDRVLDSQWQAHNSADQQFLSQPSGRC